MSTTFCRFLKREEGAVAALVAISMTVLMGFTALAVDFGMMASEKQSIQNAVDAAALAAATDIGNGRDYNTVINTVRKYCGLNGYDADDSDVELEIERSGNSISVSLRKTQPAAFSAILTGSKNNVVKASAKAEATTIFGACPYALFAGQRIEDDGSGISITGGKDIYINGNIHSNSDIDMSHAVLMDGAVATAVGRSNPSGSSWRTGSIALDMPKLSSFEKATSSMYEMVEYPGSFRAKKMTTQAFLDDALQKYKAKMGNSEAYKTEGLYIHIAGDLIFNGHSNDEYYADYPCIILAEGDIVFNGQSMDSSVHNPISLMSKNGDITVNGGGANFTGIIYAPNGNVTINGNDAVFNGSIIANNIRKTGGKITVNFVEGLDGSMPITKVHLVQ